MSIMTKLPWERKRKGKLNSKSRSLEALYREIGSEISLNQKLMPLMAWLVDVIRSDSEIRINMRNRLNIEYRESLNIFSSWIVVSVLHFAVKNIKSSYTTNPGLHWLKVMFWGKCQYSIHKASLLLVVVTYTLFHRVFQELQQLQISLSWIRAELRFYLAIFCLKVKIIQQLRTYTYIIIFVAKLHKRQWKLQL